MPEPVKKKTAGVIIPHQPNLGQRLAAQLLHGLLWGVHLTLRYHWEDRSGLLLPGSTPPRPPLGPVIYCLWHNRLALSPLAYTYVKKYSPQRPLATLVSASKDGAFLARVLELFDMQPVRGSSSRRGPQALRELATWAKRGRSLAITPDGPRGPCYVAQDGVIALAQLTGLPIVPFSCQLNWKIRVKSWDRFQVPLPFSKCTLYFEQPIRVPREATEADRENFRQQLEQSLKSITVD